MPTQNTFVSTGRWAVDLTRTSAGFTVRNGPRFVHGTVPVVSGTVALDGGRIAIDAALDLSAIDTGNARRDRDLRKPRLLDLDRHPTMRFTASRSEPGDDGAVVVSGTLSVRGRQTPLTVRVTPVGGAGDGELSVEATALLDRRSVGIVVPPFMIGRRVEISVRAVLIRSADGPADSRAG